MNNQNDNINHPSHYTWLKDICGVEVIDIAENLNFNKGCALKYILRSGRKNLFISNDDEKIAYEIEDLKKAAFFCNREADRLSKILNNGN